MIKLDDDLIAELGLSALSSDDKTRMLTHIYETLEMRVGMELAKQMSDAQLNEFEAFINRNDEAGALQWLETNFPNYKEVVAAEFEKLKLEVKQVAPQILQDAGAAQGAQPAVPQQAQPMSPSMSQPPVPQPPQPMSTDMPQQGGFPGQQPMMPPAQPQQPVWSNPAPMPQQMPPAAPQPQQWQPAMPTTPQPAQPAVPPAPQYGQPPMMPPAQPYPGQGQQQVQPNDQAQDNYNAAA